MALGERVRWVQEKVAAVGGFIRSPLLLVIRLYWGWGFFEAGKGKLENFSDTTAKFRSLGIPMTELNTGLAACTECFGGLLLLVGLCSRIVSIPLAFTMCVAYATAHKTELSALFSDPEQFVKAPPFLFLLAALTVLAFGPGVFSLDALIARRTATGGGNNQDVV